jgi:hypothetical protein
MRSPRAVRSPARARRALRARIAGEASGPEPGEEVARPMGETLHAEVATLHRCVSALAGPSPRPADQSEAEACLARLASRVVPGELRARFDKLRKRLAAFDPEAPNRDAARELGELVDPLGRAGWADELLTRSLAALPGIGPKKAEAFARRGLERISDLLFWLPSEYEDRRRISAVEDLVVGRSATFVAEIKVVDWVGLRRGGALHALSAGGRRRRAGDRDAQVVSRRGDDRGPAGQGTARARERGGASVSVLEGADPPRDRVSRPEGRRGGGDRGGDRRRRRRPRSGRAGLLGPGRHEPADAPPADRPGGGYPRGPRRGPSARSARRRARAARRADRAPGPAPARGRDRRRALCGLRLAGPRSPRARRALPARARPRDAARAGRPTAGHRDRCEPAGVPGRGEGAAVSTDAGPAGGW